MHDYVPIREGDLLEWAHNFALTAEKYAEFLGIPAGEVDEVKAAAAQFSIDLGMSKSPERSRAVTIGKNTSKADLVRKIRAMVQFRLKNPLVTDTMRVEFGLPVFDKKKTYVPVPISRPEFNFVVRDIRAVEVHFKDVDSESKARPYGLVGASICYGVFDEPPADLMQLTRIELATSTPFVLKFAEVERGKKIYAALRWQNEKGEKGPWSEVKYTFVP